DPRARRCRDTGRGGAAGFAGVEGLSKRGAAGGGAPGHAAAGDTVDLGVAALAAAKRRRATPAPPLILVAVTRSERVLHLHEAGAAVPVVLGGERRNVAVTGIHARGDARRILVQQVADTDEHAPVRLLVAHGSRVVERLLGPDVTPRVRTTLVGVVRGQVAVLGRTDVLGPPVVGPVATLELRVQVAHQLRTADVAGEVGRAEAAFLGGVEQLADVFHGVRQLGLEGELAEREIVVVVHDQVVTTDLLP